MMIAHAPLRRLAALLLIAGLAGLMLPAVALAHAELETAVPADKSTVTEPVAVISGIYSEAMKPDGSSLVVKNSTGGTAAMGGVDPEDDTRMAAVPSTPLGNGTYLVESTAVATDGHVEHATWTFTVALAASPSPSPVSTPSPTAVASAAPTAVASAAPSAVPTVVAATPVPSIAPTPVPSANGGTTGGGGSDVVLPIVVALIVLGAGAAYLLSRRNRPPDPT